MAKRTNPRGRLLCRRPTADGTPCANYADTCPVHSSGSSARRSGQQAARSDEPEVQPLLLSSQQRPAARYRELPGVQAGTTAALCDHPQDFIKLRDLTYDWCNQRIPFGSIVRDYHMHRALRAVYEELGPSGVAVHRHPKGDREAGHVVFGGGTSLVSARRLTARDSEDIDLLFIAGENVSKGQFKSIRRDVLHVAGRGAAPDVPFDQHERSSTGYIGRAHFTVGQASGYLKTEIAYVSPLDDDLQQRANRAPGGE